VGRGNSFPWRDGRAFERGRLISDVPDPTVFAPKLPIAHQLFLTLLARADLRGVCCGRRGRASPNHRTDNASEYLERVHVS
jgi:hypothetical protein